MTIKRNNPGNIRPRRKKWQGEITPPGSPFCHFASLELGCRAMLKQLRRYIITHRCNTIRKIIARWAPPEENNTEAYIRAVAKTLRISPNEPITATQETLISLAAAMTMVEHGKSVPQDTWQAAYKLL